MIRSARPAGIRERRRGSAVRTFYWTVVLLPSTVLAGIMGMNFQVGLFDAVWVFWVVLAAMLSIALVVLSVARSAAGSNTGFVKA